TTSPSRNLGLMDGAYPRATGGWYKRLRDDRASNHTGRRSGRPCLPEADRRRRRRQRGRGRRRGRDRGRRPARRDRRAGRGGGAGARGDALRDDGAVRAPRHDAAVHRPDSRRRRRVHELRASVDAVAVGMGTVRADAPGLDAREVETPRGQPRRLAFGRGPLPQGSELELRTGELQEELAELAAEGVQSLLLEGG